MVPVYGTIASQFNDMGVNELFQKIIQVLNDKCGQNFKSSNKNEFGKSCSTQRNIYVFHETNHYHSLPIY